MDTENQDFPPEWWLTLSQLCELLSIAPALWEDWRSNGTAPAHTTGRDGIARVHRADLAAWLDHQHATAGEWLTPAEARAYLQALETGQAPPAPAPGSPGEWLTVPQICAELNIAPEDWRDWRAQGHTPRHVITDGTARVRRVDLETWMSLRPTVDLFDVIDPDEREGR
ncbi:helix-turn-helix domain-containing protein [Actinomadura formosensis]|uniref:helix-turn-helix domain-containing protein n=1 Tax=Actinomadura formosensis TaxID=60706 RepID=UPI000835184B|nr:helix-turn-helix domain-containing protein [Actinomadura formosensis]